MWKRMVNQSWTKIQFFQNLGRCEMLYKTFQVNIRNWWANKRNGSQQVDEFNNQRTEK